MSAKRAEFARREERKPEVVARPSTTTRAVGASASRLSAARSQSPVASKPVVSVELTGAQEALVSRLREWRSAQAKAAGLPSFFIFSDSVLRDIAVAGPQNMVALSSVRGLGTEKLEKFGADVVGLCRNS